MMTYAELCRTIHQNPELGFQEFKAAGIQKKFLEERGFKVEFPYNDKLATAFRAEYGDKDAPTVLFMSEYDALHGLGHACGHNLIATAAVKAFEECADFLKKSQVKGRIILLGTPAEESYGGKIFLLEKNAFADADLALIAHPFFATGIGPASMGAAHWQLEFFGKSVHASLAPEDGCNALDAMISFFNSISFYRQQMPKSAQIHGIITHGGAAPNIIPDYTKALFYTRSSNFQDHKKVNADFKRIAESAAMAANCSYKLSEFAPMYESSSVYPAVENAIFEEMANVGLNGEKLPNRLTSDFGNVSNRIPAANIFFDVTKYRNIPLHTTEFRELAASDYAIEQAVKTGSVMARTAARFFTDPEFRKNAAIKK